MDELNKMKIITSPLANFSPLPFPVRRDSYRRWLEHKRILALASPGKSRVLPARGMLCAPGDGNWQQVFLLTPRPRQINHVLPGRHGSCP